MNMKKTKMTEHLRARAEDLLAQVGESFQPADIDDINKLHHELAVHQAELELQNEELHRTQLALQSARDLHVELYEHAPVGYVLLDAVGIIRRTNATWRTMLQRPDDDFCGIPFAETLTESDARIFLSRFRSLFHNPANKQIELQIRRHNSSPFHAHITAKRSVGEYGEKGTDALMVTVSDISELKQAEKALQHERDEAKRANAAKTEFLSRMSHELRTPLNAILGFAQLLQLPGEQPLNAQQSNNINEIHHAGMHLLELVNEVLDLARIDSGRLDISLEPVELRPLIERCAVHIENQAKTRDIRLKPPGNNDYTVFADPLRLQQVLSNLLSNAVKYNCEGGSITIECAMAKDQHVRVSVHDTGRGLSPGQISRLFRPFERLESAYDGIEGTGIGLALTKHLVEGMQGRIGVDSEFGAGSTFWFELPQCQGAAVDLDLKTPVATTIVTAHRQNRLQKILYIEDNPANLRLIQKILLGRCADIELLVAKNSAEGLMVAGQEQPNLILLDLNLRGMDGFETLGHLRADPATRAIPVIAVTADTIKPDMEHGPETRFDGYLTKPLNVEIFMQYLNSVFKKSTENK